MTDSGARLSGRNRKDFTAEIEELRVAKRAVLATVWSRSSAPASTWPAPSPGLFGSGCFASGTSNASAPRAEYQRCR